MSSSPTRRPARVVALVRVTSVRFTAYYALGCGFGFGAGRLDAAQVTFGVLYWLAFCMAVESLNRVADQVEDRVNRPERTLLCDRVGYPALRAFTITAWVALAAAGAAWAAVARSAGLAAVLAIFLAIGIGYSVGPRFKGHRLLALVALTTPLFLPVVTGAAVDGGGPDWPLVTVATLLLVLVSLTTAGAKDITDEEGDRLRGYRSLWTEMVRAGYGGRISGLLAAQPLVACLAVVTGAAPLAFLGTLALLPLEIAVLRAVRHARTPAERGAAREAMHTATFAALAVVVLAADPAGTALLVTAATAWWVLAGAYLHWHREFRPSTARTWWRLVVSAAPADHHRPVPTPPQEASRAA